MSFDETFTRVVIGILIGITGTIGAFYLWLSRDCTKKVVASQPMPEYHSGQQIEVMPDIKRASSQ